MASNVKTRTKTAAAKTPPPGGTRTGVMTEPPMSGPDRIAWWCLHALILLVPVAMANLTFSALLPPNGLFGGLPFTYDQFDIIKVFVMRVLTLTAVGAWGWGMLTKGGQVRRTKQDLLVVAFIGWVALTTVLSIHPATALFGKYRRFEGLVSFVNYAAVFFLVVQYATRPSRIRSLARSLVISGTAVAFYGVLQSLGLDPINWRSLPFEARRAFATYGNPDLLGGFLMFPLPVALSLALSEKDRIKRLAYWAAFAIIIWCWVVAFVRGAWIGGAVGLVALGFAAFRARPKLQKVDFAVMGMVGLLLVGLFVGSLQSSNDVMNVAKRMSSIFDIKTGSGLSRTQIWESAADAVKDRPVFGFGPDTFRLVFPKYKVREYVATAGYLSVADNVHNYPLQLTAGVGIPGFLLLYGLLGWVAFATGRLVFARDGGEERLVYAGFWCAALAYGTHLMFGLSVTGTTVFLWLALGILLAPLAWSRTVRAPGWGPLGAIGLASVVGVLIVGSVVYTYADRMYLLGRIASQGDERVRYIERAISLNPFNDMYRAELGLAHQDIMTQYLGQAQQQSQSGQAEAAEQSRQAAAEAFRNAEESMKSTIDFVPPEYDNYVFLTALYNLSGNLFGPRYAPEVVRVAEEGKRIEPYGPALRVQLAYALADLGRYDEALREVEVAADLDPAYVDPIVLRGDLYRQMGRLQDAKASYERALQFDLGWRSTTVQQSLQTVEASLAAGEK